MSDRWGIVVAQYRSTGKLPHEGMALDLRARITSCSTQILWCKQQQRPLFLLENWLIAVGISKRKKSNFSVFECQDCAMLQNRQHAMRSPPSQDRAISHQAPGLRTTDFLAAVASLSVFGIEGCVTSATPILSCHQIAIGLAIAIVE